MFWRISLWMAVVSFGGQAADGAASPGQQPTAKQRSDANRARDHARDNKTPAKPLARPQTVYRYTTKAKAQEDQRKGLPPRTHMTAAAASGRPPSPAQAKKTYGLNRKPTVRETITLPKGQTIRKGKVIGGTQGKVEYTSPQRVPSSAVKKVTPMHQTRKK